MPTFKTTVKKSIYVCLVIIFSLLSGCQVNNPTEENTILPTRNSTTGMLNGILLNLEGKPIQRVTVRLAQVYRQGEEGAFVLDTAHSPSSITTSEGVFILNDILPAEYFLVIGTPEDNDYLIYVDENGKPISYYINAGDVKDIGKIKVDFSQ